MNARSLNVGRGDADRSRRGTDKVSRAVCWLVSLAFAIELQGCGNVAVTVRVEQAARELNRARQLDAPAKAPYAYYYAVEHLVMARQEAARANYGVAVEWAAVALDYATRALQQAQRVAPLRAFEPTPKVPLGVPGSRSGE